MSYGSSFRLTFFTNDPEWAAAADAAGVDRVGLDLEIIGKRKRQGRFSTWISDHRPEQVPAVFAALNRAQRFARCNPIHDGSRSEIDTLVEQGAQVLMLPMFKTVAEAETFIELVGGRAKAVLLVETAPAAVRLPRILELAGVDEIHIGLNDLHLSIGLDNHFELLASEWMDDLCGLLAESGLPYAFGGIGRAADDSLPVSSDLVYAQYPRLGATGALVSRIFTRNRKPEDLAADVTAARDRLDDWRGRSGEALADMRLSLRERLAALR